MSALATKDLKVLEGSYDGCAYDPGLDMNHPAAKIYMKYKEKLGLKYPWSLMSVQVAAMHLQAFRTIETGHQGGRAGQADRRGRVQRVLQRPLLRGGTFGPHADPDLHQGRALLGKGHQGQMLDRQGRQACGRVPGLDSGAAGAQVGQVGGRRIPEAL